MAGNPGRVLRPVARGLRREDMVTIVAHEEQGCAIRALNRFYSLMIHFCMTSSQYA
jgi:hypothetical protein